MRHLVSWARAEEGEDPAAVDAQGMSHLLDTVVSMWGRGEAPPGPDAHIEKRAVETSEGTFRGFNYYLVAGEPRLLAAKLRVDIEDHG